MAGGGMSHPARAPRSGIDGQTNAAQGRKGEAGFGANRIEAERMSHPARAPRSGIDGRTRAALTSRKTGEPGTALDQSGLRNAAVDVGTVVRPGRVRNRTKTEPDEKVKKPADGVRKKSPPARKAPARGRFVDEYARPAI